MYPLNIIEKVLSRVAEELKIKKWRYKVENKDIRLVNYVGNLIPVSLIDESSDVTTHLMIKFGSNELDQGLEPTFDGAYKREVHFYSVLVPLFKQATYVPVDFFPACYYADSDKENRVLVLQNMTVEGFRRHDKELFLDEQHIQLTLEAVGKLHSFSFILKAKNLNPSNGPVLDPFPTASDFHYINSLKKTFKKYGVHMFQDTQYEDFFKNIYSKMSNMTEFLHLSVKNAHSLVYGHGDLWKENILFKYIDNNPVDVCLLDYQLSHLMSPAYDVLFLIMNSLESSVRRTHYQNFLSTYYTALEHSLRESGIDPREVYSEEDFQEDLKLVFPKCFCITLFSYALWLGFESMTSLLDVTGPVNVESQNNNEQLFVEIISDLINDFKDFGMIS